MLIFRLIRVIVMKQNYRNRDRCETKSIVSALNFKGYADYNR